MKLVLGIIVVLFILNTICVIIAANVAKTSDQKLSQSESFETIKKTGTFARSNLATKNHNNINVQSGRSSQDKTNNILSTSINSTATKQSDVSTTKQSQSANSQIHSNNLILMENGAKINANLPTLTDKPDLPIRENEHINLPKFDNEKILPNGKLHISATELVDIFKKKYGKNFSSLNISEENFGDIILPNFDNDLIPGSNTNKGSESIPNFYNENDLDRLGKTNNKNEEIILSKANEKNSPSSHEKYMQTEHPDETITRKKQDILQTQTISNSKHNSNTNEKSKFNRMQKKLLAAISKLITYLHKEKPIQFGEKDANGNENKELFPQFLNRMKKTIELTRDTKTLRKIQKTFKVLLSAMKLHEQSELGSLSSRNNWNQNSSNTKNNSLSRYESLSKHRSTDSNSLTVFRAIFFPKRTLYNEVNPTKYNNRNTAMNDLKDAIESKGKEMFSKIDEIQQTVTNIFHLLKWHVKLTKPKYGQSKYYSYILSIIKLLH